MDGYGISSSTKAQVVTSMNSTLVLLAGYIQTDLGYDYLVGPGLAGDQGFTKRINIDWQGTTKPACDEAEISLSAAFATMRQAHVEAMVR